MFKCAKCGCTRAGTTEYRVATAIRNVDYQIQIQYDFLYQSLLIVTLLQDA